MAQKDKRGVVREESSSSGTRREGQGQAWSTAVLSLLCTAVEIKLKLERTYWAIDGMVTGVVRVCP